MIKVQKYTPKVYYDNSRDFQLLGRVCEILYNYLLLNIDNMKGAPVSDNTDPQLLDLALLTLGFSEHHNYTNVDLIKLAEIFKYVMKIKGTKRAIEEVVYLLLRSQSIENDEFKLIIHSLTGRFRNEDWKPSPTKEDTFSIDLYVSSKLQDIILIEDMFDYILPAGFIYHIYLTTPIIPNNYETSVKDNNYVLNEGIGTNSSKVFGQVFNSTIANTDPLDSPIIHLPDTSRTFTTGVVSSGDLSGINESMDKKVNPNS